MIKLIKCSRELNRYPSYWLDPFCCRGIILKAIRNKVSTNAYPVGWMHFAIVEKVIIKQ